MWEDRFIVINFHSFQEMKPGDLNTIINLVGTKCTNGISCILVIKSFTLSLQEKDKNYLVPLFL